MAGWFVAASLACRRVAWRRGSGGEGKEEGPSMGRFVVACALLAAVEALGPAFDPVGTLARAILCDIGPLTVLASTAAVGLCPT